MTRFAIGLGVLVVILGVAAPGPLRAQAQLAQFGGTPGEPGPAPPPPPPPEDEPQDWEEQDQAAAPDRVCQKMCENDFSPCDPIYFKTEDGRCDGIDVGR